MRILITLTPMHRALFRWFGESSPAAKGPMTALSSELLPLPTTVAGAVYTAFGGAPRDDGVSVLVLHSLLSSVLGCEDAVVRGPYILVHEVGGEEWVICLHSIREGLLCVSRAGEARLISASEVVEFATGVGLRNDVKAVMTGYLFVRRTVNFIKLAKLVSKSYSLRTARASIAIEVECGGVGRPVKEVIPLGGDGYVAKVTISSLTTAPLEELAPNDCSDWCLAYLATPYLFKGKALTEWPPRNPATVIEEVAEALGLKDVEAFDWSTSQVVYGLTPTGWDTSLNKPRPTHPALLPGTRIAFKAPTPPIPEPQPLGFGTVVILPLTDKLRRVFVCEG